MFGTENLVLQEAVPELVEHALGRIKIVDGAPKTVLDEPFVLKAAENYFQMLDSDFMRTLEYWVRQSDKPQVHGYAWEAMMMNVLVEAFTTHTFSDWPQVPSIVSQCVALKGEATIVGLDEQAPQRGIKSEYITMTDFLNAHVNNKSLQNGHPVPPFFFPASKPSGPDIVFLINIGDKLFPVFVQLKLRQTMSTPQVRSSVETALTPAIKGYEHDLGRFCLTNNTFISIIIAYPAKVIAKLRPRPPPTYEYDLHPRPDTKEPKRRSMTPVMVVIDESNISGIFPKSHIDFLDRIKTPSDQHTTVKKSKK